MQGARAIPVPSVFLMCPLLSEVVVFVVVFWRGGARQEAKARSKSITLHDLTDTILLYLLRCWQIIYIYMHYIYI